MREDLDKQLCEKYPELFRDRNASMEVSPMHWGFECGDGWFSLIDHLCGCIQSYIDLNEKEQVIVSQVKEKFGTLRFYYDYGDDYIAGMVRFAEYQSGSICEECGEPGTLDHSGWITCRCEKHRRKFNMALSNNSSSPAPQAGDAGA